MDLLPPSCAPTSHLPFFLPPRLDGGGRRTVSEGPDAFWRLSARGEPSVRGATRSAASLSSFLGGGMRRVLGMVSALSGTAPRLQEACSASAPLDFLFNACARGAGQVRVLVVA